MDVCASQSTRQTGDGEKCQILPFMRSKNEIFAVPEGWVVVLLRTRTITDPTRHVDTQPTTPNTPR